MLRPKRLTVPQPRHDVVAPDNELSQCAGEFVAWTTAVGMSDETARIRRAALARFVAWCDVGSARAMDDVTHELLEGYQGYLAQYRKADGELIAPGTRAARFNPVVAFCRWMARQGKLARDPARRLVLPRAPVRLPSRVPTTREVARIIAQPDVHSLSGIRDRAILETLYATALRRMELVRLGLGDLCSESATMLVRGGKGARDRMVPLGSSAVDWIGRYLSEVRAELVGPHSGEILFLTDFGEPFGKNRLGDLVRRYVVRSGFTGRGACHLFRHACATHMLENGADIRYLQALLGHSQLSTTEIYTRVSIGSLRAVHARTHPGARGPGRRKESGLDRHTASMRKRSKHALRSTGSIARAR